MASAVPPDIAPTSRPPFQIGDWTVDPQSGSLARAEETVIPEPKVMALLLYLARTPGQIVTRDELDAALWPDMIVGEDVLSRTISKLRKILGDDPSAPAYIRTYPKRGYGLIAEVRAFEGEATPQPDDQIPASSRLLPKGILAAAAGVVLLGVFVWIVTANGAREPSPDAVTQTPQMIEAKALTRRGDDLYMNFTRGDNEAAIDLYNRAIAASPDYAPAQAGLANSLVQRVVRWNSPPGSPQSASSLTQAIETGLTEAPDARATLERAILLGERSVRTSPADPAAHKALGFALSAYGRTDDAIRTYRTALSLDPDAWDVWINLSELQTLQDPDEGLDSLVSAHAAMERRYEDAPEAIGPWLAPVAIVIGDRMAERNRPLDAERWYRRALDSTPFEPEATARLARILLDSGDEAGARQLCDTLSSRIGPTPACDALERDFGADD